MKYVKQIGIILGVTLAGEALSHFLPFPVPAGVYGLFLMLTALMSGIVKLESVEGTGNFLMDTMSMMFIPATVGIIESADQLREVLLPFLLIIATSTVIVMAVTGTVAQRMVESGNKKEEDEEDEGNTEGIFGTVTVLGICIQCRSVFVCLLAERKDKACSFKSASGVSGCYHCFSFGNRRGLCGLQSKCIRFGLAFNTGHGVPGDPSL